MNETRTSAPAKQAFRLDDSVIARIVQIIQEGMITGTDVTDLMRQLRVEVSSDNESLVQTDAYRQLVNEALEKLLKQAEELKAKQNPAFDLILS